MKWQDGGSAITVWLSATDTSEWARQWPCSELAGRRIRADFDTNGLLDYTIDGRSRTGARMWTPVDEFNAVIADSLRGKLPEDHPCYFVVVGQFVDG